MTPLHHIQQKPGTTSEYPPDFLTSSAKSAVICFSNGAKDSVTKRPMKLADEKYSSSMTSGKLLILSAMVLMAWESLDTWESSAYNIEHPRLLPPQSHAQSIPSPSYRPMREDWQQTCKVITGTTYWIPLVTWALTLKKGLSKKILQSSAEQ